MRNIFTILAVASLFAPYSALAGVVVVEGDEAQKLYDAEKSSAKILVQEKKVFVLRESETDTPKPKKITVKVGEHVFITNEEDKFVHNVYDSTDKSWVLKKQKPGGVAMISFDAVGEHKLRCAIHPKMKVKVTVE